MKTNQNMIRKMGNFNVVQRTKDGMFNATSLLKQWNECSGQKKDVSHFFSNITTDEFINAIMKEENFNSRDSVYLRSAGKYSGGTWMHPLLFIDFAMWLNPTFKVKVLKFVYDEMIKYRHEAGDEYKSLSIAIRSLVSANLMQAAIKKVAEAMNWIVFNKHYSGIRNDYGDESKQRELSQLEKKLTDLINEGFITSYENVMNYLKSLYKKNYPKVFLPEA